MDYSLGLLSIFPIMILLILFFIILEYFTSSFKVNGTKDWALAYICLLIYSIIDIYFAKEGSTILNFISSSFFFASFIFFQYTIAKYNDLKPRLLLSVFGGAILVVLIITSFFITFDDELLNKVFSYIMIFILLESVHYIFVNKIIRNKIKVYYPLLISYVILIAYFLGRLYSDFDFGVAHHYEDSIKHTYLMITNLVAIISISLSLNFIYKWHYINELKEANIINKKQLDIIKALSETDTLTNIPNRHKLEQIIKWYTSNDNKSNSYFSFVLMDLDRFKYINDTFGHIKGDEVLTSFSKILSESLRENDSYGRWGGDEFVVILPNSNKDIANKVINKLQAVVNQTELDLGFKMSFSYGVAEYNGKRTFEEIYKEADKNLYLNKELLIKSEKDN